MFPTAEKRTACKIKKENHSNSPMRESKRSKSEQSHETRLDLNRKTKRLAKTKKKTWHSRKNRLKTSKVVLCSAKEKEEKERNRVNVEQRVKEKVKAKSMKQNSIKQLPKQKHIAMQTCAQKHTFTKNMYQILKIIQKTNQCQGHKIEINLNKVTKITWRWLGRNDEKESGEREAGYGKRKVNRSSQS